jgi:16S rRNA (guanine527-N7)-methyltransferase
VKHLGDEHSSYLADLLADMGVDCPVEQQRVMLLHLDWVLDWTGRINLTAITDPYEAIRLHIADSLTALEVLRSSPGGTICDIGSGAGYPGVPLSIATGRDTVLVESVSKKARVLGGFLDSLPEGSRPRIQVSPLRAELYAAANPDSVSVVTARAVSQLGALIELAAPLLRPGGVLVALKGDLAKEEAETAGVAGELCGMSIVDVVQLALPGMGELRTLVTVCRVGDPRVQLPRRPGMAQRVPLTAGFR